MILKSVELIKVKIVVAAEEVTVGRIALHRGRILFEYAPEYISKNLNISPFYLPLQAGVQAGKSSLFEGLPGVFNDSLPDGWGRLLLDRAVVARGIPYQQLSPLDRLAYVGSRGMGALGYEPEYQEISTHPDLLDLDDLDLEMQQVLEGNSQEVVDKLLELGGSSAGARPKVLAGYDREHDRLIKDASDMNNTHEPWMIKFASSSDQPDIGNIEFAYSLMARAAGIDMPETRLFRGRGHKAYFGVKRFDRTRNGPIHMHTASGLLNADHRIPSLDYENLLRGMLALNPDMREVTKVFRLVCFNVFAHNRDDHSKNFSFLMDHDGVWSFAPAYDLTFSYGPGGEHSALVMGEGRNPGKTHLLRLAEKFQISRPSQIIDQVLDAVSNWEQFAKEAEVSSASTRTLDKKITSIIKHS